MSDLINRANAIEAWDKLSKRGRTEFDQVLMTLPSIEIVQGEWKRVGRDIYECSLCHQNVMTRDIDCYAYCHRCGARMNKGGDTE